MYAVANFEKFVKDNKERLGEQRAEEILQRAKELSFNKLVSGGSVMDIMCDSDLAREFEQTVMGDMEHIKIGLVAMGYEEVIINS